MDKIQNTNPILYGITTGLFLQLAIGPVFFFVLQITLKSTYLTSITAAVGVTLADFIYIALSIAGIGKLLEKEKLKRLSGITGAVVLALFGILILKSGIDGVAQTAQNHIAQWTPMNSFISTFVLTISSPLTIVFWTSIFTAKAVEKNYTKTQLTGFGFGAGSATFIFFSITMLIFSLVKSGIPAVIVQWLNILVGVVLLVYAVKRCVESLRAAPN